MLRCWRARAVGRVAAARRFGDASQKAPAPQPSHRPLGARPAKTRSAPVPSKAAPAESALAESAKPKRKLDLRELRSGSAAEAPEDAPLPTGPAELCVRNMPSHATALDVRKHFAEVCEVIHVRLPMDKETGATKGYAFVSIARDAAQGVCDKLHHSMLLNSKIAVSVAKSAVKQPPTTKQKQRNAKNAAIAINKKLVTFGQAEHILSVFDVKAADFNHVNLTTALHRLGLLGPVPESQLPALGRLVDRAASSISCDEANDWDARGLANACWGVAKLGAAANAGVFFDAAALDASRKIATFTAQELANTAWAFATADRAAPLLFEALAAEAALKVEAFTPQNLANTAWAFAQAGVEAPLLFGALSAESLRKVAGFNPKDFASTAWAFSKAGIEAPLLFAAIAAGAPSKIAAFNAHELSNIAWAFANAGVAVPQLFDAVAEVSLAKVDTFTAPALANTLWAFSTAKFEAPILVEAMNNAKAVLDARAENAEAQP